MNNHIKTAAIICAAAVVSFYVAQTVIPEKDGAARRGAQKEPAQVKEEARAPLAAPGEEIPVVKVEPPAPPRDSAAKAETKIVTASEIKTVAMPETKKASPPIADTKKAASPTTDTKVDLKKVPDTKKAAPYKIEKAALCGAIVNRGPHNITDKYSKDATHVYYFTHLTGARDTTAIIHRWFHKGKLIQTSVLPVHSPNWRTHSKRKLARSDDPTGSWKVEAVEPKSGKILESATFTVE